jgi:hypothetical protein
MEEKMGNKRLGLRIFVMVLVFGMVVFGCDDGSNGGGNGNGNGNVSAFNGTWDYDEQKSDYAPQSEHYSPTVYNNGNFEFFLNGIPKLKGTFTIKDDYFIPEATHIYPNELMITNDGLEAKLCSKDECRIALETKNNNFYNNYGFFMYTDEKITEIIDSWFLIWPSKYFINGNTLTFPMGDYKSVYTRR